MEPRIYQQIENGKKVDFGDILTKSFNLFGKVWVDGMIHALVSILIMIPFLIIVYAPLAPLYVDMFQHMGDPYYQPEMEEVYSVPFMIGWVLVVFLFVFLMQPFMYSIQAHFLRRCKNVDLGVDEPIGGYFTLVKQHFGKLLLLALATTGIVLLAMLLCYLPVFYVVVPLTLIVPVFAFHPELSTGEIIKASFKLGNKYWLMFFGLSIVSGMIASLGMIACGIGIFATIYFQHIVTYYFYKDSVGFDTPEAPSK